MTLINKDNLPMDWCADEIREVEREHNRRCATAEFIKQDDGSVLERFTWERVNFERIRRITGYLVGTLDRFNDGKRAEEHDRVKHI